MQLLQEGGDPNKAIYGLSDGACGYGEFARDEWPNWQVAAISASNPIAQNGQPQKLGCGACIEVVCNSTVRLSLTHVSIARLGQCLCTTHGIVYVFEPLGISWMV